MSSYNEPRRKKILFFFFFFFFFVIVCEQQRLRLRINAIGQRFFFLSFKAQLHIPDSGYD